MPIAHLDGFDYYSGFRAFPEGLSSRELDEWKTMVLNWFMAGLRSLHHPQLASMLLSLCKMDVALFHFYGGPRPEKQFFFSLHVFTGMVENPAVRPVAHFTLEYHAQCVEKT
jgi:hypothetical protein